MAIVIPAPQQQDWGMKNVVDLIGMKQRKDLAEKELGIRNYEAETERQYKVAMASGEKVKAAAMQQEIDAFSALTPEQKTARLMAQADAAKNRAENDALKAESYALKEQVSFMGLQMKANELNNNRVQATKDSIMSTSKDPALAEMAGNSLEALLNFKPDPTDPNGSQKRYEILGKAYTDAMTRASTAGQKYREQEQASAIEQKRATTPDQSAIDPKIYDDVSLQILESYRSKNRNDWPEMRIFPRKFAQRNALKLTDGGVISDFISKFGVPTESPIIKMTEGRAAALGYDWAQGTADDGSYYPSVKSNIIDEANSILKNKTTDTKISIRRKLPDGTFDEGTILEKDFNPTTDTRINRTK